MILLDKPEGMTPLQALTALRVQHPEYKESTLSYAGRLDPMASGLLLVLEGEENKHREEYLGLTKTYEFEVLFGVCTDTYDILGLVKDVQPGLPKDTPHITGTFIQEYPPYSSKTVAGVPLHVYARNESLRGIEIPTREVTVFNLIHISDREISSSELLLTLKQRVARVKGDFRQSEILKKWDDSLVKTSHFKISKYRASVSSGTYIRSLAVEMGKRVGLPALAYSIRRTEVGKLTLEGCLNIVSED